MRTLFFVILSAGLLLAGDFSNRRAPGFSLADSHYQQHDTQDYRGKLLLVEVMATTCPVCGHLADVLVQVKQKYGDKIGIISVLTNPDSYQTGDRFIAQHKISWPFVYDSGQVIASYLKVTPANPTIHFPHLFLIDQTGWIRNDFDGTEDKALTVEALSGEIDKLLAK
ncbi:MAG: TlpA disulfide reductase family protein [Terriglobia bacterium]